ncbi:MAG TPA: hypothetical protein PK002_13345 [Cellvibrio sp.]|nr:hypothetical protein [Cellvibrio sp.]
MKTVSGLLGLIVIVFLAIFFGNGYYGQTTPQTNNVASATASEQNPVASHEDILVCHQDNKKKIQPNYSVDTHRTFPLIQSAALAMKGINTAMKSRPQAGGIVATALATPAFASTQLMYATCSVVDKNGHAMCQYDATSSILGFKQETKSEGNMKYTRNITLDNGDKITVRGKEGNPHDVEIVTKETTTAWHRDQSGQETMDIYSSNNLHVVAVENADCSGTLTAEWIDGTNVHAEWQYIDENKTSGTFVSTSSEQPTLNYSLSW